MINNTIIILFFYKKILEIEIHLIFFFIGNNINYTT